VGVESPGGGNRKANAYEVLLAQVRKDDADYAQRNPKVGGKVCDRTRFVAHCQDALMCRL
jgi:hypothetical protein